jgi:hypothetical protein
VRLPNPKHQIADTRPSGVVLGVVVDRELVEIVRDLEDERPIHSHCDGPPESVELPPQLTIPSSDSRMAKVWIGMWQIRSQDIFCQVVNGIESLLE